MSSKSKRTNFPLAVEYTKQFKKDWKSLTHSGRYNMTNLKQAMLLLIANDGVPGEYLDHALIGDWEGFRECHIGGDFLLIYKLAEDTIVFVRTGTHSELF